MKKHLLLLLFFSVQLSSASPLAITAPRCKNPLQLTVHQKKTTFCELDSGALVSADCSAGPCIAIQKIKDLNGHFDSGVQACARIDGTFRFTRDKDRNEYTFCEFRDGSLISTGGLILEAASNNEAAAMNGSK